MARGFSNNLSFQYVNAIKCMVRYEVGVPSGGGGVCMGSLSGFSLALQ